MKLEQKILNLIKSSEIASFATITEDNKPWVRYVSITIADDFTIRFSTFINSRKVKQIKKNPEVHLTCGVNNPKKWKEFLQIQGRAIVTQDKYEKKSFWNEEIAQFYKGIDDPSYAVVIVKPYRIELSDLTMRDSKILEL